MRRYLAARDERDLETLANLHSFSGHVRVIGSDEHEWYEGHDEVITMQGAHLEEQPRAVREISRLEAFSNGETAWAALEMEISFERGESFKARQTIVLVIESGIWRIAQVHWSIPVANEVVDGVELTRTLADLLDSGTSIDESNDQQAGIHTKTLMFTDVVESAIEHFGGDGNWSQRVGTYFDTARRLVEARGGSVVKILGDAGMYVFPTGGAALSAAMAMQRAADESLGESAVAIGVDTGDVVQRRNDFSGVTVAKAAGAAAAAAGGQILVSASTVGMVNSAEYEFGEPVNVELSGIRGKQVLVPLNQPRHG